MKKILGILLAALLAGCVPARKGHYKIEVKHPDGSVQTWTADEYPFSIPDKKDPRFFFKDANGETIVIHNRPGVEMKVSER